MPGVQSLRSYMHYVSQELEARQRDTSDAARQSFSDAFNAYVCLVEKFECVEPRLHGHGMHHAQPAHHAQLQLLTHRPAATRATACARYDEQHDFTQQDFVQLVNANNVVLSTIKREMSGGQTMIPHSDALGLDGLGSPMNGSRGAAGVGSPAFGGRAHVWADRPLA